MLPAVSPVVAAGAVLAGFTEVFGKATPPATLHAFQATFASIGLITMASALIFRHLPPHAKAVQPEQPEVSGQR